jgi:hypothetical protein
MRKITDNIRKLNADFEKKMAKKQQLNRVIKNYQEALSRGIVKGPKYDIADSIEIERRFINMEILNMNQMVK